MSDQAILDRIGETSPDTIANAVFQKRQAGLWTAIPAIIQSFNSNALTVTARPAIKGIVTDETGNAVSVSLPLLLDCPVVFPHSGGLSLTFPINQGDECLIVFASRCIDSWWQNGGIQPPMEMRMHDLSDGFAICGAWSQPKVIGAWSNSEAQLRTDDGTAYVAVNVSNKNCTVKTTANIVLDAGQTVTIKAGTKATFDAPIIEIAGTMTNSAGRGSGGAATFNRGAKTSEDFVASGISLKGHVHSGVQTGGGKTGVPE